MSLKIIIVSHEPLIKRTYAMFNIDGYFQKGFDVEYWNVSELLGGISYLPNMTHFDFQKNIVTIKDLNGNDIYSEIATGLRERGYITNNLETRYQTRQRQ